MQLGRVWSVRLGIVLLTTGFVFLSRYTYDSVIRDLGPGTRLTFLYLLSFLLTGAGLFCERWKESLKSYGRIVAAGGLAAIYYCGFAAHNVSTLRVIENPVLASLVLFASAALFCGMSLWRGSRVMLSTSLALAFYSVSVNPIGWMACLSALILGIFGIAMMVRYRWIEIGFLVLAGSYLSYLWWQFAVNSGDSTISHWFLPAYWLLFVAASLAPGRIIDPQRHLLFSSLNNTAFFLLFSFRIDSGNWMEKHWLFCFVFGAALITLSFVGKNRFPEKSRLLHLAKGTSVITLGLALLLNGHELFVAFLLEALVLMALGLKIPNKFTAAASWASGILSCLALTQTEISSVHPAIWIFGVPAWMTLGTMHRFLDPPKEAPGIHPGTLIAAVISLLLLTLGLMPDWAPWHRALTLGSLGTVAATLALLARLQKQAPEILGTYLIGGFVALASVLGVTAPDLPHILIASTLALLSSIPVTLLCLKAPKKEVREGFHFLAGSFLALGLALLWFAVRQAGLASSLRLGVALVIPILGTLLAGRTKLLAHSIVPFAMHFTLLRLSGLGTGLLFVAFVVTAGHYVLVTQTHRLADRSFLKTSLFLITAVFWGLFILQGFERSSGLFLSLTAILLFIFTPYFGRILATSVAVPYFVLGVFAASYLGSSVEVYLCLLPLLALHLFRTSRQLEEPLIIMTVLTLIALCAQITSDSGSAPLAAIWAFTGTVLLLAGLGLKSRCFRLIGLLILTLSLAHLMLVDVIKLDPLPRILSFMTLGLGLLGLGFVYNRWQDRLKQIL